MAATTKLERINEGDDTVVLSEGVSVDDIGAANLEKVAKSSSILPHFSDRLLPSCKLQAT